VSSVKNKVISTIKENTIMYTERQNFHRISYLIFLIGLLSVGVIGQRIWSASLGNIAQSATMVTKASRASVAAGAPALLLLNTDALVAPMNGGTATLMARVRDAEGQPVAGVEVNFQSNGGTMSPNTAVTDENGAASTTFTAGNTPGQVIVTATASDFAQTAAIQVIKPNSDATTYALALEVGSNQVDQAQKTALTINLRDAAGQPVAGELVSFFGALGEVSPASAVTDANGRATAQFQAGGISGQALITVLAGSVSRSVNIQVGEVMTPVPPTITPEPPVTVTPIPPGTGSNTIYLPVVTK
jgi:hypothetical protein